jgi:hypothetical protein
MIEYMIIPHTFIVRQSSRLKFLAIYKPTNYPKIQHPSHRLNMHVLNRFTLFLGVNISFLARYKLILSRDTLKSRSLALSYHWSFTSPVESRDLRIRYLYEILLFISIKFLIPR